MTLRLLALGGLVLLAALTRLLPHPSNFAPITAMAVFGACHFGSRRAAVIAPLLSLLVSDLGKEILYRNGLCADWGLYKGMWVVYGTTALIALLGRFARDSRSPAVIGVAVLAGSCTFFLVTNFAVWVGSSSYPMTPAGLAMCYAAGVPFFRNALLGDVVYATLLFGGWALLEGRFPVLRPSPLPQAA